MIYTFKDQETIPPLHYKYKLTMIIKIKTIIRESVISGLKNNLLRNKTQHYVNIQSRSR